MDKKYLPSKQFIARAILIAGFLLVVLFLYEAVPFISRTLAKAKKNAQLKNVLVGDVVIKDSNSNGIADWEETLWGLDPTKDGPANKETILAKRKAIADANGGATTPDGDLTQNDKIARELLALIVSLKQDDNLSPEAIDNIANAIGQKIVADPIADVYTKSNIATVSTTPASIRAYYNTLKVLNTKYADRNMGDELTFIAQALQKNDAVAIQVTLTVAQSYRSFGNELTKIKVPTSLVDTHLALANNYEKTALSIEKMSTILDDQIAGMTAILNYKRYNDALIANLTSLTVFFQRNGIIRSN